MSSSRALAQALLDSQVIPPAEIDTLLAREQAEQRPLAQILLSDGRVSEEQILSAHAAQLGVEFWDFTTAGRRADLATLIADDVMARHSVLPVAVRDDGTLVVAMSDVTNKSVLQAVAQATGRACLPALARDVDLRAEIEQAIAFSAAAGAESKAEADRGPESSQVVSVASEHDPLSAAGESFDEIVSGDTNIPAGPRTGVTGVELVESERDDSAGRVEFELHVNDLLERTIEEGASDLHLTVGSPPQIRVNGELTRLDEFDVLEPNELRRMIYGILTQKQRETLEAELELDLSHPLPGKGRFRVNVFFQKEAIGAVMRTIPDQVVPLETLGLPRVVRDFSEYPRGLVLVTGPTGSGKSTTLASLVDIINAERPCHIVTVEDPIEFLHNHKRAIVNQREVGEDTHGFANALKHVLRQDPDVILVGEMRDLDTIQTALTAAETGHLVFATLHTQDAPQSIDRIIDVFPSHQQDQVRVQLATTIQAIMTQQLIRSDDGSCRYVGSEVMVATPAIRNLIREGKIYQIYSAMQAGGQHGMQTMDQSLAELVKQNKISYDLALERCANQSDLARLCGRM